MPRRPRLRLAGVPFHIIQRGNNGSACFLSDRDRFRYLDELALLARSDAVAVHSYVLMTNHIHLLATPGDPDGIPRLMKCLGQRYAQYFNRTHDRTGALWDGRYYACPVDSEEYLLTCHRYIEANPVRAAMVTRPHDYRWSSFRANALGEPNGLLSPHAALGTLGPTPAERRCAYLELFEQDLSREQLRELRLMTQGGFAFGSEGFKRRLSNELQQRVERVGSGRKRKGV